MTCRNRVCGGRTCRQRDETDGRSAIHHADHGQSDLELDQVYTKSGKSEENSGKDTICVML